MARASLDKDPQHVAAMFDDIARRYDLTNGVLSFGQDRRWRKEVLKALQITPGDRVLDLAAGTGVSSVALHEAGAEVIPCDFSVGMLTQGMQQRPGLPYIAGDATALPFADATFDAVTISFGLRNVVKTEAALKEMLRVTKPGGRIVICEFSSPTWAPFREVYEQYLMRALPKVAGLVTKEGSSYEYLAESIAAWPDQEGLGRLMLASGWEKVGFRNLSGGIVALHRGTVPNAG